MTRSQRHTAQRRRAHGAPCPYCQRTMDFDSPTLKPTRDHVVPISKIPKHERRYAQLKVIMACWTCNNVRGARSQSSWEQFMAINPGWWIGWQGSHNHTAKQEARA